MSLQRSRDRRLFQTQPVPPSVPLHPPQPMIAAPHPMSPGAFQYYHPHPHQQQQPQQPSPQQRHSQVQQLYQRSSDAFLQASPMPVMAADLAIAAAYRQQQQQQQQRPPILIPAQRMPPPPPPPPAASGWDDRAYRAALPGAEVVSGLHLSRLDSNTTPGNLENSHVHHHARMADSSRLANGYSHHRSTSTPQHQQQQQSHDRNVYWQPVYTGGTEILVPTPPRTYHHQLQQQQQRTPSPSPHRIRVDVNRHFVSPRGRVVASTPTSRSGHIGHVGRKRSRERSPNRRSFQRGSGRVVTEYRPRRQHGYSAESNVRKDDDEREDGQVTPSGSPVREEVRRKVAYASRRQESHATADSHRSHNRVSSQKRDRSALREQQKSPVKKSRFDERAAPAPAQSQSGDTGLKMLTSSGRKRSGQKDAVAPSQDAAKKDNDKIEFVPVEAAGETSGAVAADVLVPVQEQVPAVPRVEEQAGSKQGTEAGDDPLKANAGAQVQLQTNGGLQVQEVVNLEFDPAPETGSKEDVYNGLDKVEKAQSSLLSQGTADIEDRNQVQPPAIAPVTDKPSSVAAEVVECCPVAVSETGTDKAVDVPSEIPVTQTTAKETIAALKHVASEGQKQGAVISIRKNPSMPVAFKPRAVAQTSSKTWHRSGNVPSASKLCNVFTAGTTADGQTSTTNSTTTATTAIATATATTGTAIAATITKSPAYVRKGNSLVRTPGSTAPAAKQAKSSPLRAAVIKNSLKTFRPVEPATPPVPVGEMSTETERVVPTENADRIEPSTVIPIDAQTFERQSGSACDNNNGINPSKLSPSRLESSDVYYKRKTNQLVRNTVSDSSSKQEKFSPVMRTKLGKVLRLKKRSLVWTLSGSKAPPLLPWKKRLPERTRTRRLKALPKGSKGSLLSLISKKLQAFRTSQPLYTRSANGFSLHRSGLRSVAGSLKWTKSLEKRSREAYEEATKAVAAVEKRCRKDKAGGKSRERIVMVGLVRYKMDPSTRTLQRLQDSPENSTILSSSNRRICALTPRRASIGGALYVRMGNGNQLVRDPKASSRALASEKVRWSLHKVRSRISRKQQYCQFFTRYGRCNKGDSKCPYIHDTDKVVVCTKFLKGTCTNTDCRLTHKVIPERMEDCSFFLQGLCINKECPYRHVNVNPNASACEGFLKGYCASGDECNKKHTYVCPAFAATGECTDRKACRLHHPKKKEASSKPARSSDGVRKRRYFLGLELPSQPLAVGLSLQEKKHNHNNGAGAVTGSTEFISLQDFFTADEFSAGAAAGEVESNDPTSNDKRFWRPSRQGLLCFDDMSEEEVERLIKPAFVRQQECS